MGCLENLVLQIQRNIRSGVNQLETMRQEAKVIDKYASDIDANKDFLYTVEEEVMEKVDISGQGIHTTTCLSCNFTCHKSCAYADDKDKRSCCMMDKSGNCTACPCKGHWTGHKNLPY